MDRPYSVLFISRRNSARSLMAEAVVNRHGQGRFRAFSAGVEPTKASNPLAMEALEHAGYPTKDLRPKHWIELTGPHAPVFDFVFTMSDTASSEAFPEWPGRPVSAHWRYTDPVKATGKEWERQRQFARTLSSVERQTRVFMQLSFAALDRIALHKSLGDLATERAHKAVH
jgi:arsenate reductase (thioredoxin)